MNKWIEIACGHDLAQKKAQLDPLPKGPYVLVSQHDEDDFLKNYQTMEHAFYMGFRLELGYSTWVCGIDGKPLKVAYHYDCSD